MEAVDLDTALQHYFGLQRFLPGQLAAIESIMAGQDMLAVRPTGAGKSLSFQLPALLARAPTVVISPLIVLMLDQQERLKNRHIASAVFFQEQGDTERLMQENQIRQRQLKLIYCTPERLANPSFQKMLINSGVRRFIVDEAHCVSEWGNSFRPDYAALGRTLDTYERQSGWRVQRCGFTATASERVRNDVITLLGMRSPNLLINGGVRQNIHLSVDVLNDPDTRLANVRAAISQCEGPQILYCATQRSVDEVASLLQGTFSRSVFHYHGGMDQGKRKQQANAFMASANGIMVATKAFGMGVDKADIRQVLHWQLPDSLDSYVQETGRAGRDGLPATARLFYHPADLQLQNFFLNNAYPHPEIVQRVGELVTQYAINNEGRLDVDAHLIASFAHSGCSTGQAQRILDLLVDAGRFTRFRDDQSHLYELNVLSAQIDIARLQERRKYAFEALATMRGFALSNSCRAKLLQRHYDGEAEHDCQNCDSCTTKLRDKQTQRETVAVAIRSLLRCLSTHQPIKVSNEAIDDMLAGITAHAKFRPLEKLHCYGVLLNWSSKRVRTLLREMSQRGLITCNEGIWQSRQAEVDEATVLALCDRISAPDKTAIPANARLQDAQRMRSTLAELKPVLAARFRLPIMMLLPPTLEAALIADPPESRQSLSQVAGMTPQRMSQFGELLWQQYNGASVMEPESTDNELDKSNGF